VLQNRAFQVRLEIALAQSKPWAGLKPVMRAGPTFTNRLIDLPTR
jgi:hypothetical protein